MDIARPGKGDFAIALIRHVLRVAIVLTLGLVGAWFVGVAGH